MLRGLTCDQRPLMSQDCEQRLRKPPPGGGASAGHKVRPRPQLDNVRLRGV